MQNLFYINFTDKLETRRKKRQMKARDEKRREKRITEEENKKFLGKYPTPIIHIESHQHFPEFTPEAASSYQRTGSESTSLSMSPVLNVENSFNENGGLSFAKVITFILSCKIMCNISTKKYLFLF